MSVDVDVVVIGGGPAGSALARRLAVAGTAVTVVTGTPAAGVEGLSRRTTDLLAEDGFDAALAALNGPVLRGGHWGDGRTVNGGEWLIDRRQLGAAMRAGVCAAGGTVVEQPVVHTARDAGGFRVLLRDGTTCSCRELVDARGRRGRARRGPALLAIGQRFEAVSGQGPGTRVLPFSSGWCWIATGDDGIWVQVAGAARAGRPVDWISRACAEIPELRALLGRTRATGTLVARPSHVRLGAAATDPAVWRAGDAAVALDPLSGQGVYEALRGARVTAAALLSVLGGGDRSLARQFVAARTLRAWRRGVATAAVLYAENAATGSFWTDAARAYAKLSAEAEGVAPVTATPAIERRPVFDAGAIVERDVVVTPTHPDGAWHVSGVALAPLVRYLRTAVRPSVDSAAQAIASPPGDVATAIEWLARAGAMPLIRTQSISAGG